MRRSGSTGTILHSPAKPSRRRGPGLARDSRYSKIRAVLALLTVVTVVLICIRYTTPFTAHAAPEGGQHGFLQSEQNLARSGLADADSQQQTVFAGKQESITAAGRGALQVQTDVQASEDSSAPSSESLGYYWGLPKDQKDVQGTAASLQHLQKVSEGKSKSSGGQSGFYFSHDIPHDLKAASSKQGASLSGQAQGQGGLSDVQPHRKELRPPEDPNKAASKAAQGSQGAGSQQQQQEQPNPLGHYFQGGVRKSAQGPPSQEARGPPESPLKYYFTNQIPEEVKAKLALDAAVRAKGASH